MSDRSPPNICQDISRLLSAGSGTREGGAASASDRKKAQRHKTFHRSILVDRLSLTNWSLAVWDSLMLFIGSAIVMNYEQLSS
jgi:hypothetical protein